MAKKKLESERPKLSIVERNIHELNADGTMTSRIFVSKAVLLLCEWPKSRDADHLQCYVYDKSMIDDDRVKKLIEEPADGEKLQMPEYAYDCHTRRGKMMGATKEKFFADELAALKPKQMGLFDKLITG